MQKKIEAMMKNFRENPLQEIAGSKVSLFYDYASLKGYSYIDNETITLDMPTTSNVLQYFTEDNTKISIRPSGTEPKIKFYMGVKGSGDEDADRKLESLTEALTHLTNSLDG